jgi:hypothetical protein
MKIKILFCFCFAIFSCFAILAGEKPKMPSEFTIYTVPFDLMTNRRWGADDVITSAYRTIKINKTQSDGCVKAWTNISQIISGSEATNKAEIRVVVVADGVKYAFDADSNLGTVDGRPIAFSAETKAWFSKFILPLMGGD